MGGYGSGRRRTHTRTEECIILDTAKMNRQGLFTGSLLQGRALHWSSGDGATGDLAIAVQRYASPTHGLFSRWGAAGHMVLAWPTPGQSEEALCFEVPLVTTEPEYGGLRWWFLAPCCAQRVRVLYIAVPHAGALQDSVVPTCRRCLNLHYASQGQPLAERCKTYERHLLANCMWSRHEILRERYLSREEESFWRDKGLLKIQILLLKIRMLDAREEMRLQRALIREATREANKAKQEEAEQKIIDLAAHITAMEIEMQELSAA